MGSSTSRVSSTQCRASQAKWHREAERYVRDTYFQDGWWVNEVRDQRQPGDIVWNGIQIDVKSSDITKLRLREDWLRRRERLGAPIRFVFVEWDRADGFKVHGWISLHDLLFRGQLRDGWRSVEPRQLNKMGTFRGTPP